MANPRIRKKESIHNMLPSEVTARLASLMQRTDHERISATAIAEMYEMQLSNNLRTVNRQNLKVNFFPTEIRQSTEPQVKPLTDKKVAKAKYFCLVMNSGSSPSYVDYQTAVACLREVSFQRKTHSGGNYSAVENSGSAANDERIVAQSVTAANYAVIVDRLCESKRTATSRWRSYCESAIWVGSRPLQLALWLAQNGLFLLSQRDQFAVRFGGRARVEQLSAPPANYEELPLPKQLKVRCAFCKRAFEIPWTYLFSLAGTSESEKPPMVNLHVDALSQWATICSLLVLVELQHERKSPNCPIVLGVISDDVRISMASEFERLSIETEIHNDTFYRQVYLSCRAGREQQPETANESDAEVTISESAVTEKVEVELLRTCYKLQPLMKYSDITLLCPDDLVHFGSYLEHELNGGVHLGDPTEVYDMGLEPIDRRPAATPTIYSDSYSDIYYSNYNSSVVKSTDEQLDGYESLFERFVAKRDQAAYSVFSVKQHRLDTFLPAAEAGAETIDLHDYLALVDHEEKVLASSRDEAEDQSESESGSEDDYGVVTLAGLRRRIGDAKPPYSEALCEKLAEGGFFSLRRSEATLKEVCVCFWCGIAIGGWFEEADAFIEHARHLESVDACGYLFWRRGRQFIVDARCSYPVETAQTWQVSLQSVPEIERTSGSSLLRLLGVQDKLTASRPDSSASQIEFLRRPSNVREPRYDPIVSFPIRVTYRIMDREVRARKDLRVVRGLIGLCGAHTLAVSFVLEQRLISRSTDFVNLRQFLEAIWDLDARMKTSKIGDIKEFQQRFNELRNPPTRPLHASSGMQSDSGVGAFDAVSSGATSVLLSNEQFERRGFNSSVSVSAFSSSSGSLSSASAVVSDSVKACRGCQRNVAVFILSPCCHLALCADCKGQRVRCPECNRPIESTQRVYM